ncbi:MAG TPA: MAC/perforin domain-containing protein, partial [Pedobacter sp.]
AEQLVKKYGTHILQRIHIGTRINIVYQSEIPDNSEKQLAVGEGFDYVLNKVFGFFPSNGGHFNIKSLNANSSVKLRYEVVGGDPHEIRELEIAGIRRVIVNEWDRSASESNYRFVDFDKNGLIPLYDMIVDSAKKAAVKNFITTYITE